MPGIVGFFKKDIPSENVFILSRMVECLGHESYHTAGTYFNEQLGLWAGWVSHKNSFTDCLPAWNETKEVGLIFSGEDFTDQDEIRRLKAKGHEFDPENASYLVHLYEERGLKFIEKLNGWFGGLLVDLREQRAVLFNDRYGLGRIYYHETPEGFYFSSEAKSLLKVLPELRRLDPRGLAETFSCGCVLQNRTLYRGISLLPGGSCWKFAQNRKLWKETYFDRSFWENQPLLNGERYYEKLKETFARILPRYLRGPEQVAMSLTGGLDGRMIMAWAKRPPETLPCYTFGGIYRDCADVRIARKISEVSRQFHETIVVGQQFLNEFPELAEKAVFVSDGTMDVTGSVELYVNRSVARIAPIRLTGNYGSEIVRGNIAFRSGTFPEELLEPEFAQQVKNAAATYDAERQGPIQSFIAFKQVPWHHYSRLSVEQSQLTLRTPYLDNDLVSLTYQASPELLLSREPSLRLIAEGNADLARIPTDRGVRYRPIPFIGKIQHLYQEFTVKSEYAYDYGMPQWLAGIDHVLAPLHLERLFLGRHKFYHFRVWYRDKLSGYLKDILLDSRTRLRPHLNSTILEKIVLDHTKGLGNYTSEIHRLLTSELIHRRLLEER
jgi:asparagine synthase (glutamine-hydrolysing)